MSFPRVFVTGRVSLGLVGFADQIREWIAGRLQGSIPEPEARLPIAILIGGRSAQLGNLTPILIQTGLIHLIAVSGVTIAIVAGPVNGGSRRRLPRVVTLMWSLTVIA